jgi:hypothetical protein
MHLDAKRTLLSVCISSLLAAPILAQGGTAPAGPPSAPIKAPAPPAATTHPAASPKAVHTASSIKAASSTKHGRSHQAAKAKGPQLKVDDLGNGLMRVHYPDGHSEYTNDKSKLNH